jgi:hypothetical protein
MCHAAAQRRTSRRAAVDLAAVDLAAVDLTAVDLPRDSRPVAQAVITLLAIN